MPCMGDAVKRESGEIPEQYSITVKVTKTHNVIGREAEKTRE